MTAIKEGIGNVPIKTSLLITNQNGRPCLELRRSISDFDTIKHVLNAAFYKEPALILPSFNNEIQAIAKLQEKGLLFRNKKGEWEYTF